MYVTPNPSYKSQDKLTGICGNFNGRDQDDLTLPDKNTDAADDTEFGYAWRDEEDCPYPVSLDPCSDNPDRQGWAEKGKCKKKVTENSHGDVVIQFYLWVILFYFVSNSLPNITIPKTKAE